MFSSIDLRTIRFNEPRHLWLLLGTAVLLLLWTWQFARWREDVRRLSHRQSPVRERFRFFGGLAFWLCLILATASTIVALALPVRRVSLLRTGGIDVVILQDGSASMRVADVSGNRWQRSMRFVRVLSESLDWEHDDRIAMALFAHIATPEVRLTRDPNTVFFFLDHLEDEPSFRLEEDTTWDTNIELGIHWGLRLLEKDEQIYGRSLNAKVFVLISDGQAWSGEAANALALARKRQVPIFVVGVGTLVGGLIPEPPPQGPRPPVPIEPPAPIRASLDRASLQAIAAADDGQYLELDRESDRQIANTIVEATRRRAGSRGMEESTEDLHWRFLLAAACFVGLGCLFLQERLELWMQLAGAAAALLIISRLVG